MGETDISWTHRPGTVGKSWNPGEGCSLESEGCRNCYAMRIASRFAESGWSQGLINLKTRKWNGVVRLRPHRLAEPLRWRKPATVFVNSMTDMFHPGYTNEQIAAVFGVMAAAPQHTFQVLTKRARRMREWFEWIGIMTADYMTRNPDADPLWVPVHLCASAARMLLGNHAISSLGVRWPLPNVWLGVSVENQEAADARIPELLRTPAAVRFLSCEPLLGPVDLKGWGDHAPSVVGDAPETWDQFAWPEWVPEEQRRQIESFWGASSGRSPRAWLRDHAIQQVPATGARITCTVDKHGWATVNKMATSGVTGRYLHSWNNIGRIITDDGQTVCASGGSGSGWLSRWLDRDGEYRSRLHWVIAGCESGPGARECKVEWLRSLRDQCAAAGVPFFLKQAQETSNSVFDIDCEGRAHGVTCGTGSKMKPGRVVERPYLDGVQHAEFPR